ncbi:MAG TPA: hypothetical protein P5150_07085, partial [Candidatus Ratteibacteria bacterium]|nr:hypothetical protein [Candidatus Ratteibacteria bacterium]
YEQGWRVLKMNSAEGKKMVDLLSRYEQIIENRFGDKNWLDFVPTEIGVFTEMRAEINSLTEKFKQALKQFQRQNRRGR